MADTPLHDPVATEAEIQARYRRKTALKVADIHLAEALWRDGDWHTYSRMRDSLVDVIKSGQLDLIKIRHLQFICFMTSHVRPLCNNCALDAALFAPI